MNWWIYAGSHGTYVVDGPAVWDGQQIGDCPGVEDSTPKAAVQKAWRMGCRLNPENLHPLETHTDREGPEITEAWTECHVEATRLWALGPDAAVVDSVERMLFGKEKADG